MKKSGLIIATFIFFLLVNTTHYWEGKMGLYGMFTFLAMIIYWLTLAVLSLLQVLSLFREKFRIKKRIITVVFMLIVLSTSFLFPSGLIRFEKIESDSLMIAQREGAANCMTTLKFTVDHKFSERNVCFGISETTGEYRIVDDTIYFENVSFGRHENEFYEFAIIKDNKKEGKYLGDLIRFKNHSDSIGNPLWIIKNELKE